MPKTRSGGGPNEESDASNVVGEDPPSSIAGDGPPGDATYDALPLPGNSASNLTAGGEHVQGGGPGATASPMQGPQGYLKRPGQHQTGSTFTIRKQHWMTTYNIPVQIFKKGDVKYVCTPLQYIPVNDLSTYMTLGEWQRLPGGTEVKGIGS